MDDPRVGWLVGIFEDDLRKGDGLTTAKMRKHPKLIKLLVEDGTAEEATAALREIVLGMGDGDGARVLRNSLVISNGRDGIEARSGPEERRRWATGTDEYSEIPAKNQLVSFSSVRTHHNREGQSFKELAELVLDRATRRNRPAADHDAFREYGRQSLEEAASPDAFVPAGSAHAPTSPEAPVPHAVTPEAAQITSPSFQATGARPSEPSLAITQQQGRRRLTIWIGAVGAAVLVAMTATIPLWLHSNSAAGKSPTASPPPATASVSAAPNIDNTKGWGPARKTFTMDHPAPYPVFNSITDNPVHGNELNFVQCKDKAKDGQSWADEMVALDGHTYQCYLWVDNDVAPNLDSSAETNGGGNVAAKLQNARVRISYPSSPTYNPGLVGILSADNAPEVWDSCNFVAPRPVSLSYVLGSARLHTNGTPNGGAALPGPAEALVQAPGALLGDKGDGMVGQNAGYILFDMKVTLG